MPTEPLRQRWSKRVWKILCSTRLGCDLWLWRRFRQPPWRRVPYPRRRAPSAVLRTRSEVEDAAREVAQLGLPPLGIAEKFWDALAAVQGILDCTTSHDAVLDAGAELYSPILPWLACYGYRHLVGCNLVFGPAEARGPIVYEHGDVTRTHYRDTAFSAVTCMSVIEHGVDTAAFFCEMRRILKPGGLLVISTDYWDGPMDAGDRMLFGVPQKIFNREEVEGLVNTASRHGFKLLGQPDFSCRDRVVAWNGLNYTFLIMSFRLDQGKP